MPPQDHDDTQPLEEPDSTLPLATPAPGHAIGPRAGATLGERFEILELLGTGGMGEVWRAHDLQLDETVAVKFLRREMASCPELVLAFKNEIRLARSVRHVNVAGTYELHDVEGLLFITMEFVPGIPLRALLTSRALEPAERLSIVQQIGLGLSAAHARAVVHRDLKPHNVMVTPDSRVLILDFGLARSVAGTQEPQGGLAGTPQYMAPEQVLGQAVSRATDIYAFGVMLYEIYTGRLPFVGQTALSTARMHVEQDPLPPREICAEIPAAIEGIILSALSKDPARRPQSVAALVSQLERADVAARWSAASGSGGGLQEKKRLTLLRLEAADMSGLAEILDLTEVTQLRADLLGSLESVVARFGGTVHRKDEASLLAVFSLPQVRENDAERALAAAREAQAVGRRLGASVGRAITVRAALHSGPLLVSVDPVQGIQLLGEELPVADRLLALAGEGSVLASGSFAELVAARFEPLPGVTVRAGSVELAALTLAASGADPAAGPLDLEQFSGPLVARQSELAALLARLERARDRKGSSVGLRGEAGIGKSRLVFEVAQRARELGFDILSGHCRTLDEQSTLQPVTQLLRTALEIGPDTDDLRAELGRRLPPALATCFPAFVTLLGGSHPDVIRLSDERRLALFAEALVALLAFRAREHLLLLVIEDLHWIDPASLAILERVVPRLRDLPILFGGVYRTGFEPPWRGDADFLEIELRALDARAQADLIRLRLEGRRVSDAAIDIVRDRAEGNPFFLEEMVKALDEAEALEEGAAALAARIPPRIEEVILARIDRLEARAKEAIQSAAVIGRSFPVKLLDALVERSTEGAELRDLSSAGLLYEKEILPELAYIFKHAVTRDVAYHTILEKRRRALHRKLAETIEMLYKDRLEGWQESLGHHHEQAGNLEKALVYYHQSAAHTRERVGDAAAAPLVGKESEVLEQLFRLRSKGGTPWRLLALAIGVPSAGILLLLFVSVFRSFREDKPFIDVLRATDWSCIRVFFYYSIALLLTQQPYLVRRERRNRMILQKQGIRGFLITGQALRVVFERSDCNIPLGDIDWVAAGSKKIRWRLVSNVVQLGAVFPDRDPVYVQKRATRARSLREQVGDLLPVVLILAVAVPLGIAFDPLRNALAGSDLAWMSRAIPVVAVALGAIIAMQLQLRFLKQSNEKTIRRIEQATLISFHPEQGPDFVASLQAAIEKQRRDATASA